MSRSISKLAIFASLVIIATALSAAESENPDPYWNLIHDRAIHAELKLTEAQRQELRKAMADLDVRFMALRGAKAEQVAEKFPALRNEAQARLKNVFRPEQHRRLNEITIRMLGMNALLRPDVAKQLAYTEDQRPKLAKIIEETRKGQAALEKQAQSGKGSESLTKEWERLRAQAISQITELLSKTQQNQWGEMVGADFDLSRIGKMEFKAPELALTKEWFNSQPLQLSQLEGQVVVLHFYAFACVNCVHNYPHYRGWQEAFAGRGVTIVGIHTPETSGERSADAARKKAQEEKLVFPIVIDNEKQNWNAWGNTMWPTVYLIDKRGYVRYWWMGELNWQGAEGDKITRQRIEELLAE